jgi:hypothetical protein
MSRGGKRLSAGLLAGALCLLAQTAPSPLSRVAYRTAYKSWREMDQNLERDAGGAGEALALRAATAAEAAAAYNVERYIFLRSFADREAPNLQWLKETRIEPLPELAPATGLVNFVNREVNLVTASSAKLANDPDPSIRQLRQAFDKEQAALASLTTAITNRQKSEDVAVKASLSGEMALGTALEQYSILTSSLSKSADLMKQEGTAWAAYYPALAEAARAASITPAAAPVGPVPATTKLPDQPPVRPPSITALPLSRYVGVWAYQPGGAYQGLQPQSVQVTIREETGHAIGTFSARFKVPAGGAVDPELQFNFSGDFKAARNQTFALETSEGLMGSIDVNPGGPFNVMEVNFNTEAKVGKVQHGDILLVKQ